MATLPSCMYWTFTNTGLLIQDWLLKPVRPINLNEAIHQLHLSSVIYSNNQFMNSIERLNNDNTTTTTIYNDKIQQIIQIIFYFSLPLLPAATILFAIVNIFIESKHYTCPKYTRFTHPYIQNVSQYLIVYYILTCINSSLIWLIILPRYIPMSFGYYNIMNKNLTSSYIDILNDNNNNNNNTPKFITQLPAMLTMQIVLRLTLCWLIIGLLINRIYILNELYMNPLKKSFGYYINYLYTLIKQNLNDDHCLTTLNNHNHNHNNNNSTGILLNDHKQQNQPIKSIFQNLFKFTANLCSIQKCPICKSINYNWSEDYVCFICKPNYNHNIKIINQQIIKNKSKNENINLSSIINMKKMNCTLIGRLILIISLLITCSLAICLPQVWSYQLIGINLKIKLFNQYTTTTTNVEQISSTVSSSSRRSNSNSNNNHEKYYPAWRLLNKTGQTLYEYCFAAISFVIPCCTMIVCLLLLIIRLIKMKYEFNHIILHNIHFNNKKNIKFNQLYINIIKYCLIYLIQDSILILIIGIIQLCCTIPYLMTNSINRLECLLINNQSKNQFIPSLSSIATTTTAPPPPPLPATTPVTSSAAIATESFWPTRQNWLFIEMNNLFGDFLIQLIIFSVHLCETNYLLINNYKFNNIEKNIIKYQHNNYELNELMKLHEINEKFIEYQDNYECNQHRDDDNDDDDDDNDGIDDHDNGDSNDDDACVNDHDNDNNHVDINIENGNRKKLYTYQMKTPTDSGQTSKNISPLPISHTISDVLLSPKFRSKQTVYRLNQQYRTHRSTPSTLPSPLLQRIPEIINYDPSHHYQQQQQQQQRNNNCNSFTTKYPMNSYVEPKTNMASLTYSPRSRHPCRLQNKILPHDSTKSINNNTSIHMSNPSSLIQPTKLITTPNMNLTRIQQNQQIRNNSPPPLPPPPKHLIYMLGGDSSIYSTPHGSPQQANTRKYMILNSPNSNTSNNNNISVDYSPDLLHVSNISKHESSTTGSFRQTDSGVTNMGGSLIDSEQYEPNTIVT